LAFILRKAFDSDIEIIKPYADKLNLDSDGLEADKLFVANKNKSLAGFGRYKTYGNIYEISTVGVLEYFRGQGIGKIIMEKLITKATSDEIWLTTVIPEYFTKFGFVRRGNVPLELIKKTEKICKKFNKPVELNVYMKLDSRQKIL